MRAGPGRNPRGRWVVALVACVSVSVGSCATGTTSSRADPLSDARSALSGGDYETAFKRFRDLADGGHPEAQFRIGWMCFYGLGVSRDPGEAARWYRKAAEARSLARAWIDAWRARFR
jgi:TPR repeat protein